MPPAKGKEVVTLVSSESEFRNHVTNEKDRRLHLVDVFSKWCGPCQQMVPSFKALKMTFDNFDERIDIIQVDNEMAKEFTTKYPASSKPLFLFFRNGEVQKVIEGCNAPEILKTINALIPPISDDE